MSNSKTLTVKVERTIPASPAKVYSAWLNPKVKGTPWSMATKVLLNAKVDGLFYWLISKTPHYGLFKKLEPGKRIQHTWMSPYTKGLESVVNVTFKKKGADTIMTLVHTGLPNDADGRGHEEGWTYFMDSFTKPFKNGSKKRK